MIKRILCIVLSLALVVSFFVIPSSAAPTDAYYFDLLDYALSDKENNNFLEVGSSGTYYIEYDWSTTLGEMGFHSFEIVYSFNNTIANLTSISLDGQSFDCTRSNVGGGLYKCRGDFNGATGSMLRLGFYSGASTSVNIHAINVYTVNSFVYPLTGVLSDQGETATFYPGTQAEIYPATTTSAKQYWPRIEIDGWRNFETITISGYCLAETIDSIVCELEDNTSDYSYSVPFKHSFINSGSVADDNTISNFYYNITVDLSLIDRSSMPDSTLVIGFSITVPPDYLNGVFVVENAFGYAFSQDLDQDQRMLLYIYFAIRSGFDLTVETIDGSVVDLSQFFAETINGAFSNWTALFTEWADAWTEAFLIDYEVKQSFISKIYEYFDFYFPLYYNDIHTIMRLVDIIARGFPVDDSISEGMTSSGNELSGLGQQISQGTPQVSTKVDVVIPSMPDDSSGVLASTLFEFFWGQPYIINMLVAVVALATLSYVFFGKKG